jgi:hypothetical protein
MFCAMFCAMFNVAFGAASAALQDKENIRCCDLLNNDAVLPCNGLSLRRVGGRPRAIALSGS